MITATHDTTEAAIWERVIHPQGKMNTLAAEQTLKLEFSDEERTRMHELAVKNQTGKLTPEESSELDHYLRVGSMLSVLQSRARQVLTPRSRVSRVTYGLRTCCIHLGHLVHPLGHPQKRAVNPAKCHRLVTTRV